jgi:hypothetical protein
VGHYARGTHGYYVGHYARGTHGVLDGTVSDGPVWERHFVVGNAV